MLVVSIQCLVIYRILVSRPNYQGLGLGLKTWCPRSWSWSRDLLTKVLVLVSRPGDQGLGLGLEFFSKVLITSLFDSEFNSMNVAHSLDAFVFGRKHSYRVHYNRKRNVFVAFESAAFGDVDDKQC